MKLQSRFPEYTLAGLRFHNGRAETNDTALISKIKADPAFGFDYYEITPEMEAAEAKAAAERKAKAKEKASNAAGAAAAANAEKDPPSKDDPPAETDAGKKNGRDKDKK